MAAGPHDPVPPPNPSGFVSPPLSSSIPATIHQIPDPLPPISPPLILSSDLPPPSAQLSSPEAVLPAPLPPAKPSSKPPPSRVSAGNPTQLLSPPEPLLSRPPNTPSLIKSSIPLPHPVQTPHLSLNPSSVPRPSSSGPHVPPIQQPSYAQVTRGSGFVRSHARAVESFARLPRTGVKIISSSKEGMPSFSFANADLPRVEKLYTNSLVMKFFGGRPSLEASHREISSWGMENPFTIGPLNSRAFLLRFQDEKDLLKVLSRPSSNLISFPYRVFRWHNLCHLKEDSCIAPVWITLPRLPLQCFVPEFLEAVANKIGRFLCLDKATATLARPSAARVCVEIDLRKAPPDFIWVGLFEGFKQQILYERLPKYCTACQSQGHSNVECSKRSLDTPHFPAAPRNSVNPHSMPAVRSFAPPNQHSHFNPETIHNLGVSSSTITPPSSENPHPSAPSTFPGQQPSDSNTLAPADPLRISTNRRAHHPPLNHISSKKQQPPSLDKTQSNVTVNHVFWEAVNRQVSIIEQARLSTPQVDSASSPIPTPPSENLPPQTLMPRDPSNPASETTFKKNIPMEESESDSSLAADSQPNSPRPPLDDRHNNFDSHIPSTSLSEGEEPTDPLPPMGHYTDDVISLRPKSSKRNKRHPDQPLKVQLRVRKDPTPPSS